MRRKLIALAVLVGVLSFGTTVATANAEPPKFTPGWFNQNTGNPQPGFKPGGMPPGQFPAGNPAEFPGN